MMELLTIFVLLLLAGGVRQLPRVALICPALRAWRKKRGEAACVRGKHDWKRMPVMEALRPYHGMALLVQLSVAGHYDFAHCSRCGIQGRRVRML